MIASIQPFGTGLQEIIAEWQAPRPIGTRQNVRRSSEYSARMLVL